MFRKWLDGTIASHTLSHDTMHDYCAVYYLMISTIHIRYVTVKMLYGASLIAVIGLLVFVLASSAREQLR